MNIYGHTDYWCGINADTNCFLIILLAVGLDLRADWLYTLLEDLFHSHKMTIHRVYLMSAIL